MAESQSEAQKPKNQTRRIVTGHDKNGKAIFLHDDILPSVNPLQKSDGSAPDETALGFVTIAKTTGFPDTSVNSPFVDLHGRKIDLADHAGVTCRVVDFPSVAPGSVDMVNTMHRTVSIDFGVVLEGSISLTLDSGQVKQMHAGDVVVQRGTIHEWRNETGRNCKMLFVLVPSVHVKNESTGELLQGTDTTALTRD